MTESGLGWFDAFRGLYTPACLAVAGGAFAVLAFAFATIYIVSKPTDQLIADANESVPALVAKTPEDVASSSSTINPTDLDKAPVVEFKAERTYVKPVKLTQPAPRPVQAKAENKNVVRKDQFQVQATRSVAAPRLGTYDEAEDTSLRLADLVSNIDTHDF